MVRAGLPNRQYLGSFLAVRRPRFHTRPTEQGGEAWATFPLEEEWTCAYRIVSQEGTPALAEVRIYPSDPKRKPWADRATEPPLGGLTARLLRRVRVGHDTLRVRRLTDKMLAGGRPVEERTEVIPAGPGRGSGVAVSGTIEDFEHDLARSLGFEASERSDAARRPGRPRRPDLFYVRVAARYVEQLEAGSSTPTADVAKGSNYSAAHVRDALHEARVRGLLTPPPSKGRPGGQLTTRAHELLKEDACNST
jgi:hypothetical protein